MLVLNAFSEHKNMFWDGIMDKRTIVAVVLSLAVWVGWLYLFPQKKNPVNNPVTQEQVQQNDEKSQSSDNQISEKVDKAEKKVDVSSIKAVSSKNLTEKTFSIKTDVYDLKLSNRGAAIESLTYFDGRRNIVLTVKNEKIGNSGKIDLGLFFSDDDFKNGTKLEDSLWAYENPSEDVYVFSIETVLAGKTVVVQKILKFHKSEYYFDLTYKIVNQSSEDVYLPSGKVIYSVSDYLGPKLQDAEDRYGKPYSIYSYENDLEKASKGGSFFSKEEPLKSQDVSVEWAGILSRFFVAVLIPENFKNDSVMWDSAAKTGYRTGVVVKKQSIGAGSVLEHSFKVCISEKDKKKLVSAAPTLKEANDVNKFIEPIREFVIFCLNWLYKFIPNFGWTIVLFSFLTKMVFLPLTHKSTQSMKKMSALAPQMNELKAKYKDKPDVMQKETMKLYKENKVNPMGGCLPLLVQMPFFIALYSALSSSLNMWDTPFIFWIKDLSSPDALFTIKGFTFNLLPLVMTGTTFLQQKFSAMDAAGGNSQQQMMMKMMPLIMLFIFWSMPSGLILYWIIQNVLQVLHQVIVNKNGK